jgi:hypothetical protein
VPRTRLNIMLPDVPGLGVWRLETSGYNAATSLPATIELLKGLSVQPWIPAVLRLEQRSKKKRGDDGKVITHRFAVPVLDLPGITVGKVVARLAAQDAPQAPQVEAVAPSTQAERIAAQRARMEATISEPGPGRPAHEQAEGPDDSPRPAPIPVPDQPPVDERADGNAGPAPLPDTSPGPVDPPVPPPADPGDSPRCDAFHDELGACQRAAGHKGNCANKDRETWKR